MSFERFSTSDVYVFEHVNGSIECCACWFVDWDAESFPQFKTPRKALEHLYRHANAGHDIGKADVRIIENYPDLDIEIQPYVRSAEDEERSRTRMKEIFEQHPPQQFRDTANGE